MKSIDRKLANAQGKTTKLVQRLHQNTVSSYKVICRYVDRALDGISKLLIEIELSDFKAPRIQQNVSKAVNAAAECIRGCHVSVPGADYKKLGVIIGGATCKDKFARPDPSFVANRESKCLR